MKSEIDDAGEAIPNAHKHRYRDRGAQKQRGICLADIWPEPDWAQWIAEGRPRDVVARLASIYSGFANRPKSGSAAGTDAEWRTAFEESARIVKSLFELATTIPQVKSLAEDLASAAGLRLSDLKNVTVSDHKERLFFALGRGSRRFRGPFNLTLRQTMLATWLPELGWPENRRAFDAAIVPVELTDHTWAVARVDGDKCHLLVQSLTNRTEALHLAIDYIAKADNKVGTTRSNRAKHADRIGPDHRHGADISPDDLMKTFGFRGVQFGESVGQSERQTWMNELHDALMDLSNFLGLKPQWIGLRGLALAIGARGVGGALAHYEPGLRCFNYTRKRGAGSVAHEWWHALDAYLVQWVAPGSFKHSLGYLTLHAHVFDAATHASAPSVLGALREILRFTYRDEPSQFLREAWRISSLPRQGNYWYRRHELVARAFEAYVQDGLAAAGQISPYLVLGTTGEEMVADDPDLRAYPAGNERAALNQHFGALFGGLSGSATSSSAD